MNLDSIELSELKGESLHLMGEYLLIVPFQRAEPKGFLIPENKKEKATTGRVIKVGNGRCQEKTIEMVIKIGDIVIFNEWASKPLDGLHFSGKNEKLFYVKQSDVIGFFGGTNV